MLRRIPVAPILLVGIGATLVLAGCDRAPAPDAPAPQGAAGSAKSRPSAGSARAVFTVRGRLDRDLVRWRLDPDGLPVPRDTVLEAVRRAADAWNAVGTVRFAEAGAGDEADLIVAFRRGGFETPRSFSSRGADVAHAGAFGLPTRIDLNADEVWSLDGADRDGRPTTGLVQTVGHELGHVLGLDHTPDESSLLFPAYDRGRALPGVGDRAGLRALYGGEPRLAGAVALQTMAGARTTAVLDGVAPEGVAGFALLDVDGDPVAELLVWGLEPRASSVVVYRFDAQGRLARSDGPLVLPASMVDAAFAIAQDGSTVLIKPGRDGRYGVMRFAHAVQFGEPWPEGRALILDDGRRDDDGDGVFEVAQPARAVDRTVADVTGDGIPERAVRVAF